MKPFRLMHLFRHIAQKTRCPQCNAHILPENIHVDTSLDESAFLTISCPKCSQDLHAHVFVNFTDSDIVKNVEKKQGEITEEEIELAHHILENYSDGGLDALFQKQQ